MGVRKRPPQTAGRTGNRPAGGCLRSARALLTLTPLVTLLAISAIGAPFVTAGDEAGGADGATVVIDSGVTGTDAAPAPSGEPLPTADAAAEQEPPGAARPAEATADATPPSDQTSVDAAAAEPQPPDQAELAPPDDADEPGAGDETAPPGPAAESDDQAQPTETAEQAQPAEAAEPGPQDEEAAEIPPAAGAPGEAPVLTVAQNLSMVFQVLWEVQEGCQSHCYATSQLQSALQEASTSQYAEAAGATAAEAGNSSTTVQFLWQYQVGCVAFCYDTSQAQVALQTADTTQVAVALAGLTALAQNIAETLQFAWQTQVGCAHECHGASQSQSLAQTQTISQVAAAAPIMVPVAAGPGELPMWLIALAANLGATIQTIYQLQEAACLTECTGDTQTQLAAQSAMTTQLAVAGRGEPPPAPPVETEHEPPADPPATLPGQAPEADAPAAGTAAGPARPAAYTPLLASRPRRLNHGEWVRENSARRRLRAGASAPASRPLTRDAVTVRSPATAREESLDGHAVRSNTGARVGQDGARRARETAVGTEAGRTSASLLEASAEASSRWLLIALLAASLAFVAGAMALRQLQSQSPRSR
jgi:hypothetical protein